MSLPYYKRFPRDFLEGTIGLSFETKGAYAIVLDLIYMRDGRLPDDARYIAGQLGCSVRKWTAIRAELIAAGKLAAEDGIISNFRADYLTEETRKYQDKQAEIAGKPRKNKAVRQPEPSQSEPEPEEERPPNPQGGVACLKSFAKALAIAADAGCSYRQLAERLHQDQPVVDGRRRSAQPDVERALGGALRRGGMPSAILAAIRAYYALPASTKDGGQYASGAAVILNKDRWKEFAAPAVGAQVEAIPATTFDGPTELRTSIVAAKDEDFARRYIDHYCRWRAADRTLLARTPAIAATLAKELGGWAERCRVRIEVAPANNDTPAVSHGEAA
ncbi:DUF1376 domain-containing protein [Brevundimonas sp. GCM10030266]|uniref:DUF1376 domain-containing protein n=1 Tax=Brevundimonas sp. GCM10030266 TaxID=3273386 RepID=UPI003619542E